MSKALKIFCLKKVCLSSFHKDMIYYRSEIKISCLKTTTGLLTQCNVLCILMSRENAYFYQISRDDQVKIQFLINIRIHFKSIFYHSTAMIKSIESLSSFIAKKATFQRPFSRSLSETRKTRPTPKDTQFC